MEINKSSIRYFTNFQKNQVKCPYCKNKSKIPFSPFCSKKCSDLDLIKWLSDDSAVNTS